jgi:hypothetical protein
MQKTLTFLHTSPVHIATFDRLLAENGTPIPVRHVKEELLAEAQQKGEVTAGLAAKVHATVQNELDNGAAVVLCTCSTIGGEAEKLARTLRVDRPMAAEAVKLGKKIIVAAALATTLVPTHRLILAEAAKVGKAIELTELLCGSAWQKFEAGDKQGYLAEIAGHLQAVDGQADVIVLAQASMADAANLFQGTTPVLSSPRLGLEAAIKAYLNDE